MANKKYASLNTLQTFLDNLKNLFATQTSVDELSADVAYINEEDNENITDVETGGTGVTNITVDSALSETSTNPVQNKVITEKINEIEASIADLPKSDDEEIDALIDADLLPTTTDSNGKILTDSNGNVILRY